MRGQVGAHHPVAQPPAGHGVGLGEAVEQDGAVLEAVDGHDGLVFALEDQPAIDLVGEHHEVALADGLGDVAQITPGQHPAGGIMGRVQDDELGAVGDERGQFVHVQAEVHLLAQADGHRLGPQEADHGLVDGEAGIGIDDLILFFHQRQHGEENDGLAAGDNDHLVGGDGDVPGGGDVLGDGLAQLRQPGRGPVVGPALVQGLGGGLDHVGGGVEVGLADLQVDDVFALGFQGPRLDQHFEGGFGAQARHAPG